MGPKSLEDITVLIKNISNEANKLILENDTRASQGNAPDIDTTEVVWKDFEKEATRRLGRSALGWKSDYENQIGFKEGTLKVWNTRGKVPVGFFQLCALLKPVADDTKAPKVRWTEEEHAALREFFQRGNRGNALAQAMHDRFGNRRDYFRQGTLFGVLKRLGLTQDRL